MSQAFKFTDPGEGLQEAEILDVHVSAGDSVSDGDKALTVETDKTSMDIPAPFDGTIDEVKVSEGDTVEVGDVLLTWSSEDESDSGSDDDSNEDSDEASGDASEKQSDQQEDADEESEEDETDSKQPQSDKQDKEQEQDQSEDDKEQGSDEGEDSKQQADDADSDSDTDSSTDNEQSEDAESKPDAADDKNEGSEQDENKSQNSSQRPVPAAPSTRRLAREQGVDLHQVEASGPEGRVTDEDVKAHASGSGSSQSQSGRQQSAESSPLTPGLPPPESPDFTQWGDTERMPLRSIRRATAKNMARSWSQIPHVYHQDVADITELERFGREHPGEHGKLTITVLVMKALAGLMQRYPRFNASLDVKNQEIVLKHYCHIGLAVATERGLLVPVIRDVDRKSVLALADEATDLAQRARDGNLSRSEVQGGTITVTNVGPLGGTSLTPLINHPQAAIVGLAQARLEPVVSGDTDDYEIIARRRLPLVLGFDHRINDGADAARFMTELVDSLADPQSLLLAV